ncbi:MAG: 4-hydroxy-tetrahydrodipicolinate reductase, partial [Kiritimatiellae bacterium]|nr:4-hydroxy-tetrahydrodipicolinate reductase [Kiritimatiellia bacterium]
MTKIAILGAAGRMGRMLVAEAAGADGIKLAAALECAGNGAIGSDAGVLAGLPAPLGVAVAAASGPVAADVFIDFTFHTAVPSNLALAAASGARGYVLATTGLDAAEETAVAEAAARFPIVRAANMSLGVNLLRGLVRRAASLLDATYDIELVEMHHRHKKDA